MSQPVLCDFHGQQAESSPVKTPKLYKDQEEAVRKFQEKLETENELDLRNHWIKITEAIRIDSWPNLVLETLRNRPQYVRKLLAVTKSDRRMGKCLEDLVELFFSPDLEIASAQDATQSLTELDAMWTESARPGEVTLKDIYTVVFDLLHGQSMNPIKLTQRSIYTILSYLTDAQLVTFYRDLTDLNHYLTLQTLMHFASRLAKKDEAGIEVAIDILKTLKKRGVDFDRPNVMSLCTSILHGFHQLSSAGAVGSKFQELLNIGMQVNVITYNVLLRNATEHGDWETAWKIHDMMVEGKTMPDAYTYSILLNDAKWRQDVANLEKAMNLIQENGFQGDPFIVTDLLHYTLLLGTQQQQTHSHSSMQRPLHNLNVETDYTIGSSSMAKEMLDKYIEHFKLDPITKLVPGMSMRFPELSQRPGGSLNEPGLPTLHVMLNGLLFDSSPNQVKAVYHNFIRLLRERDELALILARSNYVWAMFLKSLGRYRENLSDCPRLIKKMVSLRAELLAERKAKEVEARAAGKTLYLSQENSIPEPNVYVWSILVDVLKRNKQLRAAEKILTTMESRGIKPNEVTWTTLAWGYSNAQEAGKVADTIYRMEKNGVEVVPGAQNAMLKIKDRQGLRRALERLKRKQEGEGSVVSGI